MEYNNVSSSTDKGPAPEQATENDDDITEVSSMSGVPLADAPVNIRQEVENVVSHVVGHDHGDVTIVKNLLRQRVQPLVCPSPPTSNVPLKAKG